jgi:type I restriction enzyme M protein
VGKRLIRNVEEEIFDVEGFEVRFIGASGGDLADVRVDSYDYERASRSSWTVKKWRDVRFAAVYPDFEVEVLDGLGNTAQPRQTLARLRMTYEIKPEEEAPSEVSPSEQEERSTHQRTAGPTWAVASSPAEGNGLAEIKRTLWAAADELRANSTLAANEYRGPVLGLIFLAYAEYRFDQVREEVEAHATARHPVTADDYRAKSVLFIQDEARLSHLVQLPEGEDLGAAVDTAMRLIETDNPELKDVLPKGYQRLEKSTLVELLRLFAPLPRSLSGDAFGLIYEDFLSNFAMAEGRLGGEFFTPQSIVRLIVEIIEPFHGRVFDPACGSGGMFVHCAKFVERHQHSATDELAIYGQEQKEVTVPLAKMNLALHGLSGDIRLGNSYYDDLHRRSRPFDFVMANPPFNVNGIDKDNLLGDPRYPFGLPNPDNGNYVWIQLFYSALAEGGRAGFVMANSAADAGHSEREIRRKMIESKAVDVMVAIGSNFFYTVTLPVTLWFLDKGKLGSDRDDTVLFIDARHTYHQIDRAHRDFLPEQIELLANIVRLYRGEDPEMVDGSEAALKERFPHGQYLDVPGLCKVARIAEIEAQDWSLNPGRYIGTATVDDDEGDFLEDLAGLYDEFTRLSDKAVELRARVDAAVQGILDA